MGLSQSGQTCLVVLNEISDRPSMATEVGYARSGVVMADVKENKPRTQHASASCEK